MGSIEHDTREHLEKEARRYTDDDAPMKRKVKLPEWLQIVVAEMHQAEAILKAENDAADAAKERG